MESNFRRCSIGRKIFIVCNYLLVAAIAVVTLIPIIHVIMASFSDPKQLYVNTSILFHPLGFSLEGYQEVFQKKEVWTGYRNTIIYTICTTLLGTFLTLLGGYVLSRKGLLWGKYIMFMVTFTMIFNGGMIPTYMLISKLNWINSPMAVIVPNCVSAFNLIIMRTFFQSVPVSLEESARLDGATNMQVLFRIIIPVSMAGVSVIALFYFIAAWNSYFDAMVYLQDYSLAPLQIVIRRIIILSSEAIGAGSGEKGNYSLMVQSVSKYALIMISILPMLVVYPFVQKYFAKGVMVGAVKG
ncbi:MAG: carbohydrate ABC transporter permease [Angelakisella sp.]